LELIEQSARRFGSDAILAQDGLVSGDPYQALGRFAGLEHAALVGAALAGAQLGLPVILFGPKAWFAGELAARMNTTLCPWLRLCPSPPGASSEAWCLGNRNANRVSEKTMCIPEFGNR
jgi:hypothetical protein